MKAVRISWSIGTRLRAPELWNERGFLSDALVPFAFMYGAAARLAEACAPPPKVAAAPVVCIGSVLVGGAGKTPVALALAQRLAMSKPRLSVHFLSRGYGGTEDDIGGGPLRVDLKKHNAALVGDEPLLLAAAAPTWVGARRCDTAAAACANGAQLLLMDDGLQHKSLHRDLSLLCVDSSFLLGNGRLLPAGPLREPAARGYAKADAVVAVVPFAVCDELPDCTSSSNGSGSRLDSGSGGSSGSAGNRGSSSSHSHVSAPSEAELRARLALPESLPLLRARFKPDPAAAARLVRQRVVAFSGMARPQRFFDTLCTLGCAFACAPYALPDHAPIDASMLDALRREARRHGALLTTTSKDAARLTAEQREGVCVLPMTLQWLDGAEQVLDALTAPLMRSSDGRHVTDAIRRTSQEGRALRG